MRANTENKSVDMEARDVNFMLPAYIRQYLFMSKNEDPEKIIFPMFLSVPHPRKPGVLIPIEYIPITDPVAIEIAKDGKDVPEVTPEQEAVLDEKDKATKELMEQVVVKEEPKEAKESVSPAKASMKKLAKDMDTVVKTIENGIKLEATQPDRQPKMPPGGDIGAGHPDGLGSRDARADKRIAQDLIEEPAVEEDKEIPAEIEKLPEQ